MATPFNSKPFFQDFRFSYICKIAMIMRLFSLRSHFFAANSYLQHQGDAFDSSISRRTFHNRRILIFTEYSIIKSILHDEKITKNQNDIK